MMKNEESLQDLKDCRTKAVAEILERNSGYFALRLHQYAMALEKVFTDREIQHLEEVRVQSQSGE